MFIFNLTLYSLEFKISHTDTFKEIFALTNMKYLFLFYLEI